MKKSKYQLSSHSSLTSVASSIKCSLSLQQRQLSYHPILTCLECLLPAISYWVCGMIICSGCFPIPSLCPELCLSDIFLWFWIGSLWPQCQTTREQLLCEMNSAASKEPQASVWLCPQQSEWNCNFCSSNLFYLYLKSGLFSQSNPPSASTQKSTLGGCEIGWWRWGGLAVDHWLVKTLFLHSCELSIQKWCYRALCHLGLNVKFISSTLHS